MNPRTRGLAIWGSAVLLLGVGGGLWFHAWTSLEETRTRLVRKTRELAVVRQLAQRADAGEAARRRAAALPTGVAESPGVLVAKEFPSLAADDMSETRHDLEGRWTVRQFEVSLGEIPLTKAYGLIKALESQTVPWRLTKCVFLAAPGGSGIGRATLSFEALERRP